jgi:hypothetical protein
VEKVKKFDNTVFTKAVYFNSNYHGLTLITIHKTNNEEVLALHLIKELDQVENSSRRPNSVALGLCIPRDFIKT